MGVSGCCLAPCIAAQAGSIRQPPCLAQARSARFQVAFAIGGRVRGCATHPTLCGLRLLKYCKQRYWSLHLIIDEQVARGGGILRAQKCIAHGFIGKAFGQVRQNFQMFAGR